MRIGGQYVGLGLGDSSDEIQKIKAYMRPRYSYAKGLADTPLYDEQMVTAVATMQSKYQASGELDSTKYTPGIINLETKYAMHYVKRPPGPDTRPLLLTVCGTGVPWWVGPDADTARAVSDKYFWQPVGYRAAPFPMASSIAEGRAEANFQLNRNEPGFQHRKRVENYGLVLAGYSQGAIITSELWEYDIKPQNGIANWAKDHVLKAVAWGNPMREEGKAYPDPGAPIAKPGSHGITGNLMVDTPDWWRNYAHHGDLYTETQGESGEDETAIWQFIRGTKVFSGPDSLLAQFLELSQSPIAGATAAFMALIHAGMFFGSQTGPHVNYNVGPAIDYLRSGG